MPLHQIASGVADYSTVSGLHPIGTGVPYRGRQTMLEILNRLNLISGLQLLLDAGDVDSYTSGQTWSDIQGSNDFYLGNTASSESQDPTFVGTAGGLSRGEYFSLDGGDHFKLTSSNPTWIDNLHKAGAVFSIFCWAYWGGSVGLTRLAGSSSGNASSVGIDFGTNGSSRQAFAVRTGSGGIFITGTLTASADVWNAYGFSLDEGVSAAWLLNETVENESQNSYTSPSSSSATNPMRIIGNGAGGNRLPNGSRIAVMCMWEGRALTQSELSSLYQATKTRFGI